MNESVEHGGQESGGAVAPSAADALPLFGPAQAEEPYPAAPAPAAGPASSGSAQGAGHYDAPGSSDVADALSVSDDGLPGGPTPASSGFSWRVGGGPAPVMHSQGGIPNEFDHLFRDSDNDARRSLMPSQGPIGVSIPPASGPGRTNGRAPAELPAAPSRNELTGGGDPQLPAYQPPAADTGYPSQPYAQQTYQQTAVFQPTTQVPVGAASSGESDDPDSWNTQAIPRVPVQPYGAPQLAVVGPEDRLGADRGRHATPALLISVGVFIVLVVLAAVAFSGGGSKAKKAKTPAPVDTPVATASGVDAAAKAQADAVYALITQSKGLTSQANGAITDVTACKDVAKAQQTFTDIGGKRQSQADQVKLLPGDKIPGGAQLIADLSKAWQASADSELDLAGWAGDNLTCSGKPGSNDKRAQADSDGSKAGTAKNTVVNEWNAMAAKAGQPTITLKDL